MFNGHLRIEMGNQQILKGDSRWVSSRSAAVLEEDRSDRAKSSKQLVPDRTLAAIMMTDMVGYSKEMEANEERAYSKLLEHNTIIRKYINENRGEEVKTIGDAFLVRFRSASDALEAALGIQKRLANINSDKEEAQQIWVRIGIHIGDVMLMEDDVFGNGVNVATRIEPLAEPGGICISGDVYNVVRKSIEIKVLSLGKRKLKNIADVPEIFKVLID
jgi:adenylate cyclase